MINVVLSRVRQCAIILLISSILFGSIEFGLRLFITAGSGGWGGQSKPYKSHPKYLVHLNPNVEFEMKRTAINGGTSIVSKTNTWGFRGEYFERETDEIRVIVYGDSNIGAVFSAYKDTFVARLEAELEARTDYSFQVINAGVAGYGPDQILLRIKDEIPIWNPDFVIVNLFADNDFGDILRNRLFYVSNKTGEIVNRGLPFTEKFVDYVRDLYVLKAIKTVWFMIAEAMGVTVESLDLPTRTEESMLDNLYQAIGEDYRAYFDRSLPRKVWDHYDLDIALDPDSGSSQVKLMLMEKILSRMLLIASSQYKMPIVFMIQPSSRDISTNLELNYQKFESISDKYRRDNLVNSLESILKRLNADYISLFDSYVTNGRTPYYFLLDDGHWNDRGQELAAKLMAEHLLNTYEIVPTQ